MDAAAAATRTTRRKGRARVGMLANLALACLAICVVGRAPTAAAVGGSIGETINATLVALQAELEPFANQVLEDTG